MSSKKTEQIDLYLSAITNRDPSKRQIKPVDKESFQLFDDVESESDEDFVLDSEEESDENDDIKEDESDVEQEGNNENDAENNSDGDSSSNNAADNISDVNSMSEICKTNIVTQSKLDTVMICMLCLLDVTYSDNEIIECDGCGVVVHEDCYKICDNVFMSCDDSDASTDPWFCDACLNNVHNPRCELCPVEGGVFKRTENNRWVHLLCALYTPGVAFNDVEYLTEVTLSELPLRDWSGRECSICTNPFFAKTGICISCDAGLCKNFFHVLCAQKEGLLSEPNLEENPEDPYFAQCQQHTDKEVAKRRRKNWTAAINRQKLRMEDWRLNSHFTDERLLRKLEYFSSLYVKERELGPSAFVPSMKVPCYLETNPVAVYLFKKKALNLRLPQDILNSHANNADARSGIGVPVFSPEFITYFLDREKKIDELSMEIVRLESSHRDMQISEQNTSHQFNKVTAKKEIMIQKYGANLERLNTLCYIVKQTSMLSELVKLVEQLSSRFLVIATNTSVQHNHNLSDNHNSNGSSLHPTATNHNGDVNNDSVINECCKCMSVSDQHLMIDCDECTKFFHLNCLDPPLSRMPRKTKLYGWQCSDCVRTSSDENEKQNIDINRPRQLRKVTEIYNRHKRYDKYSNSINAKNRILQNSKAIANKKSRRSLLKKTGALKSNTDEVNTKKDPYDMDESVDVSTTNRRRSHRSTKKPSALLDQYDASLNPKKRRHSKGSIPLSKHSRLSSSNSKAKSLFSTNRDVGQDKVTSEQPTTGHSDPDGADTVENPRRSDSLPIDVMAKKSLI